MTNSIMNSRDFQILMRAKTSHIESVELETNLKKFCTNPLVADRAIKTLRAQHVQIQALQSKLAKIEQDKDQCPF